MCMINFHLNELHLYPRIWFNKIINSSAHKNGDMSFSSYSKYCRNFSWLDFGGIMVIAFFVVSIKSLKIWLFWYMFLFLTVGVMPHQQQVQQRLQQPQMLAAQNVLLQKYRQQQQVQGPPPNVTSTQIVCYNYGIFAWAENYAGWFIGETLMGG